ncbi:hypothetical protein V6N11_079721 [Hibiscus sabdariffa]|uniref:Uncharacterized protein n=1 Tax=Hibiscus sabdariffa TaxID=183260 RepID=A0ABR2RWY1_9ROSI
MLQIVVHAKHHRRRSLLQIRVAATKLDLFSNSDFSQRGPRIPKSGLKFREFKVVMEDGEGRLSPGDKKILPQNKGEELNDKNDFQMVNTSTMGNGVFGASEGNTGEGVGGR